MSSFALVEVRLNPTLSNAIVAGAVAFGTFFYGGPSQLFLLGVVSLMLLGLWVTLFTSFSKGQIAWSKLHTGLFVWTLLLVVNFQFSVSADNSRTMLWVFLVGPIAVMLLDQMSDRYWFRLLLFLSLSLLFSAFWGVLEFFSTTGRASGPVEDPNSWASGLNLGFFMLASAYFVAPKRWLPILLATLALLSIASFMSYSRVGIIVFGAALLFVSVIVIFNPGLRGRAAALLMVCLLSFASIQFMRPLQTATNNTEGYTLSTEAYGWTVRFAQWNSALAQSADYPVLGSGLGTFGQLYPQYRSLDDESTAGFFVHNDYLQLLAEAGPLALLLIAVFIGFLLWQMLTAARQLLIRPQAKESDFALQVLLLVVAIGTVLVHALMNFTLYNVLNQLLIGCALARILWLRGFGFELSLTGIRPVLLKSITALVVVFSLAVLYSDAITRDLVYRGGIIPLDRSDPNDRIFVFEILSSIRSFRSNSATNRFAMATFYRSSFDEQPLSNAPARQSLAIATALEYQSGLELNPRVDDIRGYFAEFLIANPWLMDEQEIYQTPERLYREGLSITPLRLRPRVSLARYLNRLDRQDEAYDVLLSGMDVTLMRYPQYRHWRLAWQAELRKAATEKGDSETLAELRKAATEKGDSETLAELLKML